MAVKKPLIYKLLPRTLRGRLIAGLVAVLAIGCATVGLVTYFAVERALYGELDNQLQTATQLALNCWGGIRRTADKKQRQRPAATNGRAEARVPHPVPFPPVAGMAMPGTMAAQCTGVTEGTFVARIYSGSCKQARQRRPAEAVGRRHARPARHHAIAVPAPGREQRRHPCRPSRYMSWAQGTYRLTAILDPDHDGYIYITGLPLSDLNDFLSDVALVEARGVRRGGPARAGVLGTFWVRFSLRPLRRVAITASQVAELPLESGEVSMPAGVPDTDPNTETGQVGLAFNRMLGHVETALRRRAASESRLRRFAADASHELRTPLAAIRGYAELALRHPGESPEPVTHALGRVLSESTRMSVLVDDLLLLARLDAGRPLSSAPVDMTRLAIDATSDAQVARPGHRWVLELPDDPELVLGDEHRLRQVLGNLLSNAGRHTPDGTTVTVRVSGALPDGEPGSGPESASHGNLPAAPRLVVSVTDDGPGIPAALLPDLFERFTRADTSRSHATNASSTGLGLAIVDAVVTAHHGAVLVTSRPGMTRFTITLARLAETPAPTPPARTGRR